MSEESARNWTVTYIAVLLIEALVIWVLWLFSWNFSY